MASSTLQHQHDDDHDHPFPHEQQQQQQRCRPSSMMDTRDDDYNGDDDDDEATSSISIASDTTFHTYGLLEHIFTFVSVTDLLNGCVVNRRWKEAGRMDSLWMELAYRLWKDKVGMPRRKGHGKGGGEELALYWRTMLSLNAITKLSVRDIRALFASRPLGPERGIRPLVHCVEKDDMRDVLVQYMPDRLVQSSSSRMRSGSDNGGGGGGGGGEERDGDDTQQQQSSQQQRPQQQQQQQQAPPPPRLLTVGFDDIWFGSYTCSVIDSTRNRMTMDEICTPQGFDIHFKVAPDDFEEDDLMTDYEEDLRTWESSPSSGGGGGGGGKIKLMYHATCYFDTNFDFRMDTTSGGAWDPTTNGNVGVSSPSSSYHPNDLIWKWTVKGRVVQVGPYPPLVASRTCDDWGWKLENMHVVLFYRGLIE